MTQDPSGTLPQDDWAPRLRPDTRAERAVRSIMGWGLAYPWFDALSLWALTRYYFPMSRLWAAASVSSGVIERFLHEVPLDAQGIDLDRLQAALFRTESARAIATAIDARWQQVFFGGGESPVEERVAVEAARLDAADRFNRLRGDFRFLLGRGAPILKARTPTPDQVAEVYGGFHEQRYALFAAPDPMPEVEVSARVPGAVGTDFWLRFKSPGIRPADTVTARVHEPAGVRNPPTLVFAHGICVDFDHWHGLVDEVDQLCAMGVRVIRPEAPYHGRRRPPGLYSGEAIVAHAPIGALDTFSSALREWSVLLHWARQTSSGPLAIGGSSLGALSSLLCADVCRSWPEAIRPQAALLITHSGRQRDALIRGALAKVWKSAHAMHAAGWSSEQTERYMTLLDPSWHSKPALPAENIITVLGRYDHVTPFDSGVELLDAWGVPQANRFIWKRGHFSVPMTMIRRPEPLHAFCDVLKRLAAA
ncbi:MAG: hypothetical protein R3E83_21090 [Burkholderiaceae bacterium]